jgi:hypothetical protein
LNPARIIGWSVTAIIASAAVVVLSLAVMFAYAMLLTVFH